MSAREQKALSAQHSRPSIPLTPLCVQMCVLGDALYYNPALTLQQVRFATPLVQLFVQATAAG